MFAILFVLAVLAGALAPVPAAAQGPDCTAAAAPGVVWRRCTLEERPFTGVDLTGADLREARFFRSDLSHATLAGADARRARFVSANLVDTDLSHAKLQEADFTNADLSGAVLAGADLSRARLYNTNLRGADLTGARLERTDIQKADLSGAIWLDGEHICREDSIGQCFEIPRPENDGETPSEQS